ncbi:MAG: glycosyltransferase [Candidatus Omnitrophica bacterium]|nr:glycosyltransferase [Candidatus Omnitrophota bacterium]
MKVSVVIPTLNRPGFLKNTLESLKRQTRLPDEVIVVDQSTDGETEKIVREYGYSYVFQAEKSCARARNRGLRQAAGNFISFVDDDVVLHDDYFEKALEAFRDPAIGGVSGCVELRVRPKGWKWALRRILLWVFMLDHFNARMTWSGFGHPFCDVDSREIKKPRYVELISGYNMIFRRKCLEQECFDSWFSGYSFREDAELTYRVSKITKLKLIPDAKFRHVNALSNRLDPVALKQMQIRNYYYVFRKHRPDNLFFHVLFGYSVFGLLLIDFLEAILNRDPEKMAKLKAAVSVCSKLVSKNNFKKLKKRKRWHLRHSIPQKIKVLHIIKTLNLGGAEANLYNLVTHMDKDRVEVHVAYSYGGEIESRFRETDVRLYKYAEENHRIKSLDSLKIIWRLARYIRKNKIQIVHTHNFNAHLWGLAAARLTGTKLVEHVHDFRYTHPEDFRKRRGTTRQFGYARYLKHLSNRVIVLTRENRDFLVHNHFYPKEKIQKVYNGIPAARHQPLDSFCASRVRTRAGIPPNARVVLTAARIAPEKNIDLIFRIAPRVIEHVPDVFFVIAGDGPLLESFRMHLIEMELEEHVRLLGFYPNTEELLAVSDIFLLPSFLELHSIALLEAMSMKVPAVISEGVGCHGEFIESWKSGVLVNPYSDQGWAESMVRLLGNENLRREIGENGYQICMRQFNIRQAVKKIENSYAELIYS